MSIRIIGAMSLKEHGVGFQNIIPWKQKADMDRFKKITQEDGVIIMGSNTFASFKGYVLPKRIHIVLTSKTIISEDERVVYVSSMREAIKKGNMCVQEGKAKGISIIGGYGVWKEGLQYSDILNISYINTDSFIKFDTFFPDIDVNIWKEIQRENFSKDSDNQFDYSFVNYVRK